MSLNTRQEIQDAIIRKESSRDEVMKMLDPEKYISILVDRTVEPATVRIMGINDTIEFDYWNDFKLVEDIGKYKALSITNDSDRGFRMKINKEEYSPQKDEISLLIYDKIRNEVVDFAVWTQDGGRK